MGFLAALCIAAVSPTLPPTRIAPGSNITVTTNGVNSFTIAGSITNYGQNFTNLVVRQSSGNALTVNTNVLVVATNKVGVNTALPLAPIHVGPGNYVGSVDPAILVSRDVDNTGPAGNGHGFSDSSYLSRGGGISYNSFDARANIVGGNSFGHYAAFQAAPSFNSATNATMDQYYGYYSFLSAVNGLVRSNFNVYVHEASTNGGTLAAIGDNYGVFIEPLTLGTNVNFAIYADGTTPSTFGGAVKVGQLKFAATAAGAADAGVSRYAADVLEINNGTANQRRDLMVRELWDSGGNKVVGTRQAAVADAAATAGTATAAVGWGFVSQAEFDAHIAAVNALKDQVNALLARLRTHGLIAP